MTEKIFRVPEKQFVKAEQIQPIEKAPKSGAFFVRSANRHLELDGEGTFRKVMVLPKLSKGA